MMQHFLVDCLRKQNKLFFIDLYNTLEQIIMHQIKIVVSFMSQQFSCSFKCFFQSNDFFEAQGLCVIFIIVKQIES